MRLLALMLIAAALNAADLPVKTVILYKNGVGYFERAGELRGGESARLDFKAEEMNDVLKSLTIEDKSGSKIVGLRYDSSEPTEKKLEAYPFTLADGNPLTAFLDQLKGSRLELKVGAESAAGGPGEREAQSAAAPSPFPPIADYGFLSNCHTGALVAPDGAIDWLCVPSFDSPSIFGSLLDREAGSFRFGPYGIDHPTARDYEPGTNVLAATFRSPSGWVRVHDALTIGPRSPDDLITPHRRPPTLPPGEARE